MIIKRVFNKFYRIVFYVFNSPFYGALGKNSVIKKPLVISFRKRIFIGEQVTILPMARIEPICHWGGKKLMPKIIIDDGTQIGQGLHLTAADRVHIHKNVLIAPYVYITDVMHDYENVNLPILSSGINFRPTEIRQDSHIGIGVKIMAGVHIGKHCVIGANAVVTKNIPDYCVAAGIPARIIKKYNKKTEIWEKVGN